jgi:exopolysaccharide production protein ExoZ
MGENGRSTKECLVPQIRAIQMLRALAALMVVFAHAQNDTQSQAARLGLAFARDMSLPWVAGVDLFFVTSGFIMVHASRSLFAKPGAARTFLTRRVIRIAPLYWLVTAISLVVLYLAARMGKEAFPHVSEILGSFGFMPYENITDHIVRPIAGQGWTLNYEMFFYVLFAIFLRFALEDAILGVAFTLSFVVMLGAWLHPTTPALAFWSDPIVLEFALGMGIAWGWREGWRLGRGVAGALALVAVAWLARDLAGFRALSLETVEPNGFPRLVGCGLPMALLFACAVWVRPGIAGTSAPGRSLSALGDASYALYLFHPLAIIATRKAYLALHLDARLGLWPLVAVDVAAALVAAFAVYRFVESPMTRGLQRAFAGRPAVLAPG